MPISFIQYELSYLSADSGFFIYDRCENLNLCNEFQGITVKEKKSFYNKKEGTYVYA